MKRTLPLCGFVLAAFAVASGCSSAPVEPSAISDIVISKDAVVATQPIIDSATVTASGVTFPASGNDVLIAKLKAGAVFVGSPSDTFAGNKEGFLRKVKTVKRDGANVVLTTDFAVLADVVKSGKVGFARTPVAFVGRPTLPKKSVKSLSYSPPADLETYKFKYAQERTVLASFKDKGTFGANGTSNIDAEVALEGAYFAFDPSIGYKFDSNGLDSSISVSVSGKLAAGIGIKATVTSDAQDKFAVGYTKDFGKVDKEVYKSPPATLPRMDLGVFTLQPSAQLVLKVECEKLTASGAAMVEAGANATANADFSASVSLKGIKQQFSTGAAFSPYWDATAKAEFAGKCGLVAEVSVSVSGSAVFGAVTGEATAKVSITAGIEGDSRVNVSKTDPRIIACGKYDGFLKADASISGSAKLIFLPGINASKEFPLCDIKFGSGGERCSGSGTSGEGETPPASGADSCTGRAPGTYCSTIGAAKGVAFVCGEGESDQPETQIFCEAVEDNPEAKPSCSGGPGNPATRMDVPAEGEDNGMRIKCE
jgi:hypothetical protein